MQKESGPIGELGLSKNVHIAGAGISGLLMAYYLKKAGYQVTIFEKNARPGGKIQTVKTPAGIAEKAANAIFTNEDVIELLQELRLPFLSPQKKLKKKIWRNGKARSFPLAPWELPILLAGLFKKVPKDLDSLSVYDFFCPLLGKKASYEVLSAVFGGIYATDAKTLHFKSVFKNEIRAATYFGFIKELIKTRKERTHRPTSISFEGGMHTFIDALSEELKDNFIYEKKTALSQGVNTIICADALDAPEILESIHPNAAKELKRVDYQALSTATYISDRQAKPLENSFGILFSPKSGFKSSGILNNSAIFQHRTQGTDRHSHTFISQDPNFGKESALEDLNRLDSKADWPSSLQAESQTDWERGIPIYDQKRRQIVKKLRSMFHGVAPGLVLFGNYVDGISIREMTSMAKDFAGKRAKNS
ncbi:MAG: FAD-dependent oxidoreductase [Bacteriovoracaceae bacterium]